MNQPDNSSEHTGDAQPQSGYSLVNDEEQFSAFVDNYYRIESSEAKQDQLVEALRFAINDFEFPDPHTLGLSLYFFARAASLDSSVLSRFESLLDDCSEFGTEYVSAVVTIARGQGTPKLIPEDSFPIQLDPLRIPVQEGADLDYLWAEFFVTGNQKALAKIMEVKNWPDRIRTKLESWLSKSPANSFERWRKKYIIWKLKRKAAIRCDLRQIRTEGDLDRLVYQGGAGSQSPTSFWGAIAALPFPLSDEETVYLAAKGVAEWSLFANAPQHPLVVETLQSDKGQPTASSGIVKRWSFPREIWAALIFWLILGSLVTATDTWNTLALGTALESWFRDFTAARPVVSAVTGILAFLVSVLVGIFRQVFSHFNNLSQSFPTMIDEEGTEIAYSGIQFGQGNTAVSTASPAFRLVSWLFVAVTSVWAAAVVAAFVNTNTGVRFAPVFIATLFGRWMISTVVGIHAAHQEASSLFTSGE